MPGFTVLTVNTHMGFSAFKRRLILRELREAVRTVSADIVFLQEVMGSNAHYARLHADWPEVPQYEFLADSMWSEFAYGRNAAYPHGHHGNALLSKFPILHSRNHDVSVAGQEGRGLLHCVLDTPGTGVGLHVVCTHFGLRESCRARQFDLLGDLIVRQIPPAAPLVVAGDFNDWRGRGDVRLRQCAGVREVFLERFGRLARSFPVQLPLLPLDRIYVRNLELVQPRVLSMKPWSHLSDHAALVAELRMPGNAGDSTA